MTYQELTKQILYILTGCTGFTVTQDTTIEELAVVLEHKYDFKSPQKEWDKLFHEGESVKDIINHVYYSL